jgi:hypothetical protein
MAINFLLPNQFRTISSSALGSAVTEQGCKPIIDKQLGNESSAFSMFSWVEESIAGINTFFMPVAAAFSSILALSASNSGK